MSTLSNNPNLPTYQNPPPPPPLKFNHDLTAEKARSLKKPKYHSIDFILLEIDYTANYTDLSFVKYESERLSIESITELRNRGFEVKEYTYLFFWKKVKISW